MKQVYKGICASDGVIKAEAFIIRDLNNLPELPTNEFILVAPYTTPILNQFIASAAGIVCEMGGMTCHAAIIAREFGIPCVVGIKGIIEQMKDDQIIELNPQPGEVALYE